MPFIRLPETVLTLYAELLDQLRAADAEATSVDVRGSFVSKQIRGRIYWYLQKRRMFRRVAAQLKRLDSQVMRQVKPLLLEEVRALSVQNPVNTR